jgi:hypothetical protein
MNKEFLAKSFQRLETELKKHKWRDADRETDILLLSIATREKSDDPNCKTILVLPEEEIKLIDQLWSQYSNGRFGFTVQKGIWIDCGGQPGVYDKLVLNRFGDAVGWRKDSQWLMIQRLKYNDKSPYGHLPTAIEHQEYCKVILSLL